ncbi:uncharacterized protein O3C94_017517 isoform 1-T2 [Discoglossus pictus]
MKFLILFALVIPCLAHPPGRQANRGPPRQGNHGARPPPTGSVAPFHHSHPVGNFTEMPFHNSSRPHHGNPINSTELPFHSGEHGRRDNKHKGGDRFRHRREIKDKKGHGAFPNGVPPTRHILSNLNDQSKPPKPANHPTNVPSSGKRPIGNHGPKGKKPK